MIMTLSVVIHTKNAAATLKRSLSSVEFADEIVIIDMHSTDDTLQIARRFTRNIYTVKDEGYADPARNFGLQKATGPWILVIDADEVVPPDLAKWIKTVVKAEPDTEAVKDAYYLPRKNIIFDHWISHTGWWPDYQLRFFKKGHVEWLPGVHRLPQVTGSYEYVPAEEKLAVNHYNYGSIEEFISRLNRYTDIAADEKSLPAEVTATQAVKVFNQELCRRLFAEQGVNDGLHGTALSLLQANYELVVFLKQWQKLGFKAQLKPAAVIEGFSDFKADLAYWIADYHVQHQQGLAQIWWRLRRKFKF